MVVSKFLDTLGYTLNTLGVFGVLTGQSVCDAEKFMDMLFFNYITKCFVVLEIKAGDFESPNTGQLGTYVVAVNHQMKEDWMNPTIGLLICKDKDEIEAQYALESSSQPHGISSYELSDLIPDKYKYSMPAIEEIETELAD